MVLEAFLITWVQSKNLREICFGHHWHIILKKKLHKQIYLQLCGLALRAICSLVLISKYKPTSQLCGPALRAICSPGSHSLRTNLLHNLFFCNLQVCNYSAPNKLANVATFVSSK